MMVGCILEAVEMTFEQPLSHGTDAPFLHGVADSQSRRSLQGLSLGLIHRVRVGKSTTGARKGVGRGSRVGWGSRCVEGRLRE